MSEKKEQDDRPDRTTLPGMIWNASHILDQALDPKCKGIPRQLLEGCKGVAIISVVEAGFIFSGHAGTGVLLARRQDGSWSPPSALGLAGVGFGALFGAAIKDVIILLVDDEAINSFTAMNTIKLGGEVGVAVGPVGREMSGDYNISGKGAGQALSYTFSKGLFAGVGLEGAILRGRATENERFYGQPATPQEILSGDFVQAPEGKGIEELHRKLEIMRRGETCIPSEEEQKKKEQLRLDADKAGNEAKASQGTDVEHVVASDLAT